MTFRVGQKVVCVNTDGWSAIDYAAWSYPRKGEVCTVTGSGVSSVSGQPITFLAEHKNPDAGGLDGFLTKRFRPVVERKTDISIFTAMLDPSKRSVDA